jgi:hypothetical protein
MSQETFLDDRAHGGRFRKGVHAYRKHRPHWDRDWLDSRYTRLSQSAADIAIEADCTENNILFWLKKHGIPRRSIAGARAVKYWGATGESNPMFGKTGAANPRYIDGGSPERQRLYVQANGREFLKAVYKRDGYRCVKCLAGNTGPKTLHAHHVRPWAGNPDLRFDLSNAVTLCKTCHSWVHSRKNTAKEFLA